MVAHASVTATSALPLALSWDASVDACVHGLQWPTHRQSFTGVSAGTDLAVIRDHTGCVAPPRFVVQLHDATRLNYDFRLQVGDVLRSWAVPRGPSLDPAERRLAVQVEDHSLAAGEFEGVHRGQARGSGAVIIWDEGTLRLLRNERDHLSFELDGYKLHGRFGLSHTRGRQWILVKALDDEARRGSDITAEQPTSVRSGRTWREMLD